MYAVPPGFNGTIRLIAVPAAGTFVPIVLSRAAARGLIVRESILTPGGAAQVSQGFLVKVFNDTTAAPGFSTVFARPAASLTNAPGEFPSFRYLNEISEHGPHGEGIGPYDGATAVLQVSSLTATATTLEVWEFA